MKRVVCTQPTGSHFTGILLSRGGQPSCLFFTGKEPWNVWFNRFTEVADRRRWSEDDRLDEILPRLQGAAGEFVFGQLRREVGANYAHLVSELNSRFRVVVTKKTYGAQFSHCSHRSSESVEEYAAELKRLYDKAHADIGDEGLLGADIMQEDERGPGDLILSRGILRLRDVDIEVLRVG